MIKVGVVGSRRRNTKEDKDKLKALLWYLVDKHKDIYLVSGGCPKGADRFAEEIAEELGVEINIHYPDKNMLPINPEYYHFVQMYNARNTLIANECDILLALPHEDRRGGTEDTIKKCRDLGKEVVLA